jgi:F-type H+-transporting ATPase subunit gamma
MAKTQTIRRRIKSVKNIHQITKTMEMVAASKLHRAQEAALQSRMYAFSAREALTRLKKIVPDYAHPLFAQREIQSQLIIVFTSDRGLAGAYNGNIFRKLVGILTAEPNIKTKTVIIGQKGGQFVSKIKDNIELIGLYPNWPSEPTIVDLQPIVSTATHLYAEGIIDRVSVLFTDYISTIRQTATLRNILPVNPEMLEPTKLQMNINEDTAFEPSPEEVLSFILPRLIEMQIYQANLEAIASEQAMRMMAMKSASDSANDIMDDLSLAYNGIRQAAITQELSEITSGAEAIN